MLSFFVFGILESNEEKAQKIIKEVDSMCQILKELKGKEPNDILEKYGVKKQCPVDIVGIAQKIGIQLGSFDFSEIEKLDSVKERIKQKGNILGVAMSEGENVFILYNNKLGTNPDFDNLSETDKRNKLICRQRFTIAHEIGHCCLHMSTTEDSINIEYRTDQADYTEGTRERQANIFAGELLIPYEYLFELCLTLGSKVSKSFLADIFKVSKHVMDARINYLQSRGCLLNIEFIA